MVVTNVGDFLLAHMSDKMVSICKKGIGAIINLACKIVSRAGTNRSTGFGVKGSPLR